MAIATIPRLATVTPSTAETDEDTGTAALQAAAPGLFLTTNQILELEYSRAALRYYDHQMQRAADEIRNLRIDLARARGESLRALGVVK